MENNRGRLLAYNDFLFIYFCPLYALGDLSKLCPPLYLLYLARKCHGQKRSLRCQGSGVKYELVEKSDDIVFCHRLFQEVFAYQHVLTKTQTMGLKLQKERSSKMASTTLRKTGN